MTLLLNLPKQVIFPMDLHGSERERYRRIGFSGACNFRDMGGYATKDGHTVKWGVLYRSDNLNHLSPNDENYLSDLRLNRVIDLRADYERADEPDRVPSGAKVVRIPVFNANSSMGQGMQRQIMDGKVDGMDPVALMLEANSQFATTFTPQFKQTVQEVLSARGKPVLIHCTAGKDRTGFAAAILLRALGVPEPVVFEDYMLSKKYVLEAHAHDLLLLGLIKGQKTADFVRCLYGVEPAYLGAAFTTIDRQYGTFDSYVHQVLGLTDQDIQELKTYLLE